MQTIEFIDSLKTGVEKIDKQHEALVDMINLLIRAREDEAPPSTITFVLGEMTKYVYLHFRDEEQFMFDHFYMGMEEHRLVHKTFEAKVQEFQELYNNGDTDLLDDILEFLMNWLVQHIQGDDYEMVQEVLSNF